MATLNAQDLLNAVLPQDQTPAGFQMAENALSRGQITGNLGLVQQRLTDDFNNYTLPDLASGQAARGAFRTSATGRKGTQALESYTRQYGDIGNQAAYSLAGLGLSDVRASIPGATF
jgi:hypothetical protein